MTPALLPQITPAVPLLEPGPAFRAYERCAHYYDLLTADYDHDAWLASVDALARKAGFAGDRVLDVACGTGKSAAPMVRRGYRVSACDLSPAMVRRARLRLGGSATVFVADMRRLPEGLAVDLLTCLDDALNYLLSFDDLVVAISGFARALAPSGVACRYQHRRDLPRDVHRRLRVRVGRRPPPLAGPRGHARGPRGADRPGPRLGAERPPELPRPAPPRARGGGRRLRGGRTRDRQGDWPEHRLRVQRTDRRGPAVEAAVRRPATAGGGRR